MCTVSMHLNWKIGFKFDIEKGKFVQTKQMKTQNTSLNSVHLFFIPSLMAIGISIFFFFKFLPCTSPTDQLNSVQLKLDNWRPFGALKPPICPSVRPLSIHPPTCPAVKPEKYNTPDQKNSDRLNLTQLRHVICHFDP